MEDTLIQFDTAKLAKEVGFDLKCLYYASYQTKFPNTTDFNLSKAEFKNWNDDEGMKFYERFSIPTQGLLQKWIRETHNINISVEYCDLQKPYFYHLIAKNITTISECYKVYELCLEQALFEALNLIKDNGRSRL